MEKNTTKVQTLFALILDFVSRIFQVPLTIDFKFQIAKHFPEKISGHENSS